MLLTLLIKASPKWIIPMIGMLWGFLVVASMLFENPFTLKDTLSGFLISGNNVLSLDQALPFEVLPALLTVANFILLLHEVV
jgi:hypothetical protein